MLNKITRNDLCSSEIISEGRELTINVSNKMFTVSNFHLQLVESFQIIVKKPF
jgi:hypothetical protein